MRGAGQSVGFRAAGARERASVEEVVLVAVRVRMRVVDVVVVVVIGIAGLNE